MQTEIRNTVQAFREGKVVLYPSDTIWGIGCDATNPEAVAKLKMSKSREKAGFIVLVANDGMLQRYVKNVPDVAWELIDASHKPLTIIYDEAMGIVEGVSQDKSIAVRMVKEGFIHRVIHQLGKPITSTSANISGEPSPKSYTEISAALKEKMDYCVPEECYKSLNSKASSIIKLSNKGDVEIIRR
ncbi:MAG: L-threonylcarbamoyladenylate synthase [Bacteroidota bacterium]